MEEYVYSHLYQVEKEHWWYAARAGILMQYIASRIPTTAETRVLDVGCGTGAILELLSQRYRAFGTDLSPQAIGFCRKRGLTNLHAGTLGTYPATEPFDIITMFDMLEHVDDDPGLLREAYTRLREGGFLLIAVPAYPALWSNLDVVLHHKRRYTRASLERVVVSSGFRIQHITFMNTLLFPLALIRRAAARVFRTDTSHDLVIPSARINRFLKRIFELEAGMVSRGSLPVGLSLVCLAQRPPR